MELTCLVDNTVAMASPFWGEHGLSFLIETKGRRILFDAGQSGTVLMHNLEKVKLRPKDLSAVVLSHGHCDHTGGLPDLLESSSGLPVIGHPAVLDERFRMRKKKPPVPVGFPMSRKKLDKLTDLRLRDKPFEVMPCLWTTGGILKRAEPEGRGPKHVILRKGEYIPDPYLDDLSLVWQADDGLVVILGCAHAGLLNILAQVRETFAGPVKALIGGTHLQEADEGQLNHVIEVLARDYPGLRLYPNHCTGNKGFLALVEAFGSAVQPCPTGTVLEF